MKPAMIALFLLMYLVMIAKPRFRTWAALTVALICNILLNTVFLIQIGAMVGPGNEGFWSVMWTRVIKNAVQFPVNGIILFGVWKALKRIPAQLRTF